MIGTTHTQKKKKRGDGTDENRVADQLAYFEFMGLIVGKALYEGILMDVAFAEFFLKKCLGGFNYCTSSR